ncbi:rCG45786 [Rattus norvegicus]|uniref:RCG45786 n=1 Tax=Rattus norvegicus TaxID=10116 RepID=A6JUB0_RAT|nr:rCG45786 [Rattus norvegicus]
MKMQGCQASLLRILLHLDRAAPLGTRKRTSRARGRFS